MLRDPSLPASTTLPAASPAVAGHRPLVLALAIAACFAAAQVRAQASGARVLHGSADIVRNGSSLTVTTRNGPGTNHSAIDWQSFGVPAGSTTWFQQPGATSTSINRVVGPDPSGIYGRLGSNGRLVLVNPAGIAIGAGAVVDTGGFTASTLRMSEADAIAGRLNFAGDASAGPLSVQGQVVARGGDIVLVAPKVEAGRQAVLTAQDGSTILAAGRSVDITGRGLEGIVLHVQAGDAALNLGKLQGDAVGIFANTLRHSGLAQAHAATAKGGRVVLRADGGDAIVAGKVTAVAANDKGGSIAVLGQRVGIVAGAEIDASAPAGGGKVRIGGDYRGKNPAVPNAARTYVDPKATIRADALRHGDGGSVIVWADEFAQVHGRISARGGPLGGNGGFVETSSRVLDVTRGADVSAPRGRAGRWLLDPEDVDVGDESDDNIEQTGPGRHPKEPRASRIHADAIVAALDAGGTVEIDTEDHGPHGNGTIRINRDIVKTSAAQSTLELHANRDIRISGAIRSAADGGAP